MAFTKVRQDKSATEIDNARSKFNVALQNVLEKRNESPSSSGDESNKESTEITIKREPSPISNPVKKQTQRTQRKRRKKDDSSYKASNTCVMKLYDRAVDLSPFSVETPLYPICRAWINNQPHQLVKREEPEMEDNAQPIDPASDSEKPSEEEDLKPVLELPPPKYKICNKGNSKDARIPSPIPPAPDEFVICSDEQGAPSKDILLAKHMERWRAVRQKWKQAAQANEERYKDSSAILRAIFEKSQCRGTATNPEQWEAVTTVT